MKANRVNNPAKIEFVAGDTSTDSRVLCRGDWTFVGVKELVHNYQTVILPNSATEKLIFDGTHITSFDSAGAWLLRKWVYNLQYKTPGLDIRFEHFTHENGKLTEIIAKQSSIILAPFQGPELPSHSKLYRLGREVMTRITNAMQLFEFIGQIAMTVGRMIGSTNKFIFSTFTNAIDEVGWQALPITAMMAFLIGVVLSYQMGLQLKPYGANIYIVNITGKTVLREFGVLITAIIASGRTASAFTAQIGLMKVKEEIDALRCMGLSPIERLVVPKIFGAMVAIPLLAFWANLFGMMGAMVMAEHMLDIPFTDFFLRFRNVIEVNDYMVGMYKAPVFALIIAAVGCFQGFRVSSSAESVGWQTTKSVVQSIFLIILADAGFSVLFNWADM